MRVLGVFLTAAGLMGVVAGCTHHSLTRNTVWTTGTVMDIQYRSVLTNLALMSCQPEALPSHVHLADGVVQINDRAGFGQAGGFTTFGGTDLGVDRFGPSGQRQITEQWGTDATTDPERLYDLQCLYRVALGIGPLPPPNAIEYLRRPRPSGGNDGADGSSSSGGGSSGGPSGTASTGGGGSTPGGGSGGSGGGDRGLVPIEILMTDVPPPGWFQVGCKAEVPKHACYVGRWGDRYAWVMPDGIPDLARFTASVLTVIKLSPGERGGAKSGLAVTGGN
jgi:uncharacterized membrane protein YgcG